MERKILVRSCWKKGEARIKRGEKKFSLCVSLKNCNFLAKLSAFAFGLIDINFSACDASRLNTLSLSRLSNNSTHKLIYDPKVVRHWDKRASLRISELLELLCVNHKSTNAPTLFWTWRAKEPNEAALSRRREERIENFIFFCCCTHIIFFFIIKKRMLEKQRGIEEFEEKSQEEKKSALR